MTDKMKEELSPFTGKPMVVVAEPDSVEFRGEKFFYTHLAYKCQDTGEQFTTTELDEVNANQVYNAYRYRHGMPFPDEIIDLRKHYGVSAAMMSDIMGFGANQWRYYEADKVPNESNSRTILAIRNKSVFLDFLESARNTIGDKAYGKTKAHVESLPPYTRQGRPSERNGFISYSPQKTTEAIKYFIYRLNGVFTTKMNKLLFYADFTKYRHSGFGLTGLEYRAITHGPVPNGYGEVYSKADGIEMEEYIYPNGTSGILLVSQETPDMEVFSELEREILSAVCDKYSRYSAGDISQESHQEKGWKECIDGRLLIPYTFAFDMVDLLNPSSQSGISGNV